MNASISAFRSVPDFAKGLVKDLRVRWAFEEAGLPYQQALIDAEIKDSPEYRAWQPFGQVPAYRDETVSLFETGAIVLHIADRSEALAPRDPQGRARTTMWVFAALNSVEPFVEAVALAHLIFADAPWASEYRAGMVPLRNGRLTALATWLDGKDYLDGRFTAGDLMMATVLRNVQDDELASFPVVAAYRARCLARPAFARALKAQLDSFETQEAA